MMYVVWGLYKVIEDDIQACMMRMSESEMITYYGERRTEKEGDLGPGRLLVSLAGLLEVISSRCKYTGYFQ